MYLKDESIKCFKNTQIASVNYAGVLDEDWASGSGELKKREQATSGFQCNIYFEKVRIMIFILIGNV